MFIVEGNIGVGKSTFLKKIGLQHKDLIIVQEPLQRWTANINGESLLNNFYKNPSRWAYTVETAIMFARVKNHIEQQANKSTMILMERSIYSGHYCFALCGKEKGYFSNFEWDMYERWVTFFFKNQCHIPHGFVYLQASYNSCANRIKKRDRKVEKGLPSGYLEKMEKKYDDFLIQKYDIFEELKKVPVLVLDCDDEFIENEEVFEKYCGKVINFMCNVTDKSINEYKNKQFACFG
jgi:deoxyadenosine/deoxycytidine kinase